MLVKEVLIWLKQSSCYWYKKYNTYVLKIRFNKSSFDGYFYYKFFGGCLKMFLIIYVDDMLLASESKQEI